jgi:hypothetical protein
MPTFYFVPLAVTVFYCVHLLIPVDRPLEGKVAIIPWSVAKDLGVAETAFWIRFAPKANYASVTYGKN